MQTRNSATIYLTNFEKYTEDDLPYINEVIQETLGKAKITTDYTLTSLEDVKYVDVNETPNPLYGKIAVIGFPINHSEEKAKWYRSACIIFHKDLITEGKFERVCFGVIVSTMQRILNMHKNANGLILQKRFTELWEEKRSMFKYNEHYSNEMTDNTPDLIYTAFGKLVSFLTKDKQIIIDQYEKEKKSLDSTFYKGEDDKLRLRITDNKIPRTHIMHVLITNVITS